MDARGFTLIELAIVIVIIGILAVLTIPNYDRMASQAKEAEVKANCHTVQCAAEDFAVQNNGVYASNVDVDATPAGGRIIDLLPGGVQLENPFTKARTEPVNGAATNPGETGYAPIAQNGTIVGYTISGVGRSAGQTVIMLASGL